MSQKQPWLHNVCNFDNILYLMFLVFLWLPHLSTNRKPLANHLLWIFFSSEPLANGWPLAKGFASISNHLQRDCRVTCKETNLWKMYMYLIANKPICKEIASVCKCFILGILTTNYVWKGSQLTSKWTYSKPLANTVCTTAPCFGNNISGKNVPPSPPKKFLRKDKKKIIGKGSSQLQKT